MKNNWKKYAAIAFGLGMMATLPACGSISETKKVPEEAGSYELLEMTSEGATYDRQLIQAAGMDVYTMELDEDGTGTITIDGTSDLTWGDGKIRVEGEEDAFPYEYKDNIITITVEEGNSLKFGKDDALSSAAAE